MDPMANISSSGAGANGGAQQNNDNTVVEARDVCDLQAMKLNESKMDKIKSYMGIISGCCAGILGLTNIFGLLFFMVCHLVVNGTILLQIQGDLETFRGRQCTKIGFVMEGIQNCALSYMLFWTLFYGLVYLF
jgi:hypothetical protein